MTTKNLLIFLTILTSLFFGVSFCFASNNVFDSGYPPDFDPTVNGGNFWSDYTGQDNNNDGIGDVPYNFQGGQDGYPFMKENGWAVPVNQPSTIESIGQYKSDNITPIEEGKTITENTIVFKAVITDPDNDKVKLQVELRQKDEQFTGLDDGGILTSDFVNSGSEATITRPVLSDGQYHWRYRAIDDKGNASSDWQNAPEFGTQGNVDFVVKTVPLYIQRDIRWRYQPYANATPDKPYLSCGWSIGDCGCAITSEVMILRFYDITPAIDNKDVNPLNFNNWFANNNGYWSNGDVKWEKIEDYSKDPILKFVRLQYEGPVGYKDIDTLDIYLDILRPVILYTKVLVKGISTPHFIVADGKLASTYTIKDPAWYETKYLIQVDGPHIYNYNNNFYGLRLFSPAFVFRKGLITMHLASPAEFLITDPLGRKLGKDPINNIEYNEIPGGSYYLEGTGNPLAEVATPIQESKNIWIPEPIDGKYDIQTIGTESGSYTMGLSIYDQIGQSKDLVHEGATAVNNIQEFELNYSLETVQETEVYRMINIDIKPGSYPNSISLKSKGVIPVAILTTEFFNAKDVIMDSVLFAGAPPLRGNLEDIDNDNDLDLVLHFDTQSLKLSPTGTEAVLVAKLKDGIFIKGIDSVRIVGK